MKSAIIPHIDHANDVGPDQTSEKATCPGPTLPVIHTAVSQTHIQVI